MDEVRQYESCFMGRNIMFLMPSLASGGAERVIVTLIKYLDRTKYTPVLVILNQGKNPLDLKEMGCEAELINLNVSKARYAWAPLYKLIKSRKPDTVVSTLGYVNEILSLMIPFLPKTIRYIARESSIPSMRNKADKNAFVHEWIYNRFMKRFDVIVCQSMAMFEDMKNNYGFTEDKLIEIDNPVDREYLIKKSQEDCNEMSSEFHNVIAIGSLKSVKNYGRLIKEAANAPENYRYYILGEGVERKKLEDQIRDLNLIDKVKLLGHQSNPWKFMARADEFWQKSHWEGNSNAKKEWEQLKMN
ncbi:MAG: hypothetical protein CL840_22130 [Crocinitomicaceae bacterium]|nr:hypothetical protein [Crocinitomicaceae bacterium]|tara:strand:- start:2414 stop:3319 length:906 start_codon:yes stop_codon:yes gene_type:complete